MSVVCLKCSSYLDDASRRGIVYMDLGSSRSYEHHVLGWVKIKEYECPKISCSNTVAVIDFVTEGAI
tara:strand:+ start:9590 stop:9790 length:201 start_codon:yes stop_codon:yes gene_type:complete